MKDSTAHALKIIQSGSERFIGLEGLAEKLNSGKTLRVKFGLDPTRPDLTFGHMVVFNKLRQIQDLGHTAILLVGDYTARIGDPSGRSSTRTSLSKEEVQECAKTYLSQAFKVLDEKRTVVCYNSEWLEPLKLEDILGLCSKVTVARMIERDDFSKRFSENTPISLIEFLYPILQGYDSVALEADLELGGNDQLFNLLMGRNLQKDFGQSEQSILCMPLLVGLDGIRKMSKSFDNYIAFNDTPTDMFGKIMSISDETMWSYYSLLLLKTESEISTLRAMHPLLAKKKLAIGLVSYFYDENIALAQLDHFEKVFSKKELPDDMPSFQWQNVCPQGNRVLIDILANTGLFSSKKELKRLIEQSSLKINGQKQTDPFLLLEKLTNQDIILQMGKRTFLKITD